MAQWEKVYTVNNYFDGPRLGVADFEGSPHIFKNVFDAATDDWSDEYELAEISPDLLALVLEDWKIWIRWQAAFKLGKVGIDTHPALPAEGERHEELKAAIGDRLDVPLGGAKKAKAIFRGFHIDGECGEVQWLD